MTAEPRATVPAPPKRASAQPVPCGQRIRVTASTAIMSPMGHTAAPIWGASPGVQPGGWWAAGSQACRTLAAMEVMDPKRNPVQATSRPPAGVGWWSGSPGLAVWLACWSPALVTGLVAPPGLVTGLVVGLDQAGRRAGGTTRAGDRAGDGAGGVIASTAGVVGVGLLGVWGLVGGVARVGGDQRQAARLVGSGWWLVAVSAVVGWLVAFGRQVGQDAFDGVVGGAGQAHQGGSAWCRAPVLVGGVDGLADLGRQVCWRAGEVVGLGAGHWVSPRWALAWAGERVVFASLIRGRAGGGIGWTWTWWRHARQRQRQRRRGVVLLCRRRVARYARSPGEPRRWGGSGGRVGIVGGRCRAIRCGR